MISKKGVMLLIVLVILMGTAFFYFTQPPQLEIKNEYGKLNYSVQNITPTVVKKKICAVSTLNQGEGNLNLTVILESVSSGENHLIVNLYIFVNGSMPGNLIPSRIEIKAQELEESKSSVDFDMSFNKYINITPWKNNQILPGTWAPQPAYIGGSPEKGNFMMVTHLTWRIWDFSTLNIHTLRITAENAIFEDIIHSTIDVVVDTSNLQ